MSKTDVIPNLTAETATTILSKVVEELQSANNQQKLDEARDNVGNEMLKMMQYLFPIVMQIQTSVIKEFGFPENREGIVKFALMIRNLEKEDVEVARLHSLIKSYYLPPVCVNTNSESGMDDRISSN